MVITISQTIYYQIWRAFYLNHKYSYTALIKSMKNKMKITPHKSVKSWFSFSSSKNALPCYSAIVSG